MLDQYVDNDKSKQGKVTNAALNQKVCDNVIVLTFTNSFAYFTRNNISECLYALYTYIHIYKYTYMHIYIIVNQKILDNMFH